MTATYEALAARFREILALEQAQSLLGWDQQTVMPRKGAQSRAEQLAALELVIHERYTSPELAELVHGIDRSKLDPVQQANVRLAQRHIERAQRIPASLATELSRLTSLGQTVWADARRNKRFADFAPTLARIVELKRQEAQCLADGGKLYDALLDAYEPAAQTTEIATIFERLRPQLVALLKRTAGAPHAPSLGSDFPTAPQLELARDVIGHMGYDFDAGRIDLTIHPFCSGKGPGDVRIATRARPDDLQDCLYSTIHEAGHALYEQNIDPMLELSLAGNAASMAVHESQSRLWENQIARSRAFIEWLYPQLCERFELSVDSADAFYAAINRVEPSFIRTEADEVTYNLHVILRFDLERDLIDSRLEVSDLEQAWNLRVRQDFELEVTDPSLGVLQDVHWSAGAFGYFPTYTLGNIYAAELFAAMAKDLGPLDPEVARGEFGRIRRWLTEKIHRHGSIYPPRELMLRAIGRAPTEQTLVDYLERKFAP